MINKVKLNSGYNVPIIGLGTWKSESGKVSNAVEYAITNAGYRHIDCASIYGNEPEIGLAFPKVFSGKIKRDEVFVTSKLWNTEHNPDNVEKACRKTLSDLKLEYLDLYLMHWGIAFQHGGDLEPLNKDGVVLTENFSIKDTWNAMENLVKKGLVKSIGVANFTTMMLVDLISTTKTIPAMNQIELHPYNTQEGLIKYCTQHNIAVTAYSPLGRQGVDGINKPRLAEDKLVSNLANKYNKTVAQILINWAVNRGTVAIPKSTSPDRILENIESLNFEISTEDIHSLNNLNTNLRYVDPSEWWGISYFA